MVTFTGITPILRIFDEEKAKQFYLDFLDFHLDWEHRYEPDLPLYMQVSRGACVLHLSEHFGDGSPGAHLRIKADGIEVLQQQLLAKQYKYARPGLNTPPWGTVECSVQDPFGNRLIFYEQRSRNQALLSTIDFPQITSISSVSAASWLANHTLFYIRSKAYACRISFVIRPSDIHSAT